MKFLSSLALMLAFLLVPACFPYTTTTYKQVNSTVAVPEVQYVEATLIEGKTTKQQVLDALGTPNSLSDTFLSYNYYTGDLRAKLHIVQKDGTELNVILGEGLQHRGIMIHFSGSYNKKGKHVPSNIMSSINLR